MSKNLILLWLSILIRIKLKIISRISDILNKIESESREIKNILSGKLYYYILPNSTFKSSNCLIFENKTCIHINKIQTEYLRYDHFWRNCNYLNHKTQRVFTLRVCGLSACGGPLRVIIIINLELLSIENNFKIKIERCKILVRKN